ncbi:MAG TPA: response regulator transcription factor [Burkholderiaceae bacterium]|nr:response regulator transcription factor [Burkholderiaceae bacterium]
MYGVAAPVKEFRIVIADDHPVVRAGIATLLETSGGFKVVAQANTGVEAVEQWKRHRPDLILIDLKMPAMGGLEAIARIRAESADAAVVVLTTFDGDEDIFRAMKGGARGYLLKDASAEELVACLRSVCDGRSYIPAGIAGKLASRISTNALTERERQILAHVASGESNKRIALKLQITEGTVKTHIASVLSKLDATSRTEAVAIARRRGLIDG